MATLFEASFAAGPARAARRPWLWSERFARFALGERWSNATRGMFKQVAAFLKSVHGHCPIEDVLFWGRREASSRDWDRWSEEQLAEPTYPGGGRMRTLERISPMTSGS